MVIMKLYRKSHYEPVSEEKHERRNFKKPAW